MPSVARRAIRYAIYRDYVKQSLLAPPPAPLGTRHRRQYQRRRRARRVHQSCRPMQAWPRSTIHCRRGFSAILIVAITSGCARRYWAMALRMPPGASCFILNGAAPRCKISMLRLAIAAFRGVLSPLPVPDSPASRPAVIVDSLPCRKPQVAGSPFDSPPDSAATSGHRRYLLPTHAGSSVGAQVLPMI